jgi:hypothetical protein
MQLSKTIDELEADFYAQKPKVEENRKVIPLILRNKSVSNAQVLTPVQGSFLFPDFYTETQL